VRTAVAGRVRLGGGRTPLPPAPTLEFVAKHASALERFANEERASVGLAAGWRRGGAGSVDAEEGAGSAQMAEARSRVAR